VTLVVRLTPNRAVVSLSPIKGLHCFLEQETWPSLLSTGWSQEGIQPWFAYANCLFHNRTQTKVWTKRECPEELQIKACRWFALYSRHSLSRHPRDLTKNV